MRNFSYFTIILSYLLFPLSYAEAQGNNDYLTKSWNKVELGLSIGSANILCNDFDGDGTQEMLFNGNRGWGNGNFFTIYSKKMMVMQQNGPATCFLITKKYKFCRQPILMVIMTTKFM